MPEKVATDSKKYTKDKPEAIASLFDSIAPHYDRVNAYLSFGLYKYWNSRAVREVLRNHPHEVGDLCGGTGEFSRLIRRKHPSTKTCVIDLSSGMLALAKKRGFKTLQADVTQTGLPKASFDSLIIAYGIRNVSSPACALKEARRLLKPGGRLVILELTRPRFAPLRLLHKLHLRLLVPLIGKLVTRNKQAYSYLSSSIGGFIEPKELEREMKKAGFATCKVCSLTGGIATLFMGDLD